MSDIFILFLGQTFWIFSRMQEKETFSRFHDKILPIFGN